MAELFTTISPDPNFNP